MRLSVFLFLLCFSSHLYAAVEIESNNTVDTANTLTSGEVMTGALYSKSDTDYFKINVGSSGVLTIDITSVNQANLEVLNPAGQIVGAIDNIFTYQKETTSVGVASSGFYFIRILSDTYSTTDTYDLTVTYNTVAGGAEVEPNNSSATANTLTSGEVMTGALYSKSDTDYFKINVGSSGVLTIDITSVNQANLEVLNPAGQIVGAIDNIFTYQKETTSVGVASSGFYFIRILSDTYSTTDTYDLTVTYTGGGDTSADSPEAFVERFYQNILGRPSDPAGKCGWVNIMNTESSSRVAFGFLESAEFESLGLDDGGFVDILYRTLFDREADASGKSFWLGQLAQGRLREMIIYQFTRSQEFKTLSDSFGAVAVNSVDEAAYGIRAFTERFYTIVLGRQPDISGFDGWVAGLTAKTISGGDLAKSFFLSPEYSNKNTSDSVFIDDCYQAFFDRAADPAGKEGWLNFLAQGRSRDSVLDGFIGSAEFVALAASYGINASRVAGVLDRPEDDIAAERRTQRAEDAEAIPALPMLVLLILTGLIAVFGIRRLRAGEI